MAKAKFRKIEQQKTFTRREQYENALTRDRTKNRAKSLSYVEIDIGDGEMANVYFTPMPASILRLKEKGIDPVTAVEIILETLAACVVEPGTGEPLMTLEEWRQEDTDFINNVTTAAMGIQLITEAEIEASDISPEEVIEVEVEDDSIASDPNPLDVTPGSSSPISSITNSASADHQNVGEEEASKNG